MTEKVFDVVQTVRSARRGRPEGLHYDLHHVARGSSDLHLVGVGFGRARGPRRVGATVILVFLASAVAGHAQTLRTTVYASGFSSPVAFVQDPTDRALQYVVEQGGRIRLVFNGVVQSTPFLDLTGAISSGGERGLLGHGLLLVSMGAQHRRAGSRRLRWRWQDRHRFLPPVYRHVVLLEVAHQLHGFWRRPVGRARRHGYSGAPVNVVRDGSLLNAMARCSTRT
jgi:hypothetical protein